MNPPSISPGYVTRCEKLLFRHNDCAHLETLLQAQPLNRPKIIIFEFFILWMATLVQSAKLQIWQENIALSYLDEVHAVGMYVQGGGIAQMRGVADKIDVIGERSEKPLVWWAAISLRMM